MNPQFDYPSLGISDVLIGQLTEDFEVEVENLKLDFNISCPIYDDYPCYKEKMLGWHQEYGGYGEHPDCPSCKTQMEIVIRLEGFPILKDFIEDRNQHVFSIFMCSEHHECVQYKWFDVGW